MVKKHVSRGRGPRIREDEVERMTGLYLEGKTFEAIGREVGRHWQTVRKYIIKDLQERPGAELRREALKDALVGHFQDLVTALRSVVNLVQLPDEDSWEKKEFEGWQARIPDIRTRILLDALREGHAEESPLWSLLDTWNSYLREDEENTTALRGKVEQSISSLIETDPDRKATTTEYLALVLFRRVTSIARGKPINDPSLLKIKKNVPQNEGLKLDEIWLGSSTHLATGERMDELKKSLAELMESSEKWAEIGTLHGLLQKMAETKDKIEMEVEVLSLKRAFPGRCRVCPI